MLTIEKEEGYPVALLDTLLVMVERSIGSRQYLSLFIQKDGVVHDVIENGRFACAFFASAKLTVISLTKGGVHSTVVETIEDMISSSWYTIDSPIPGSVVVWGDKLCSDGNNHKHIGFYLGNDVAVSTDGKTGVPTKHHVTYDDTRRIEAIYFHERLLG